MPSAGFYANWYLHLPSLVLAALICLLAARLVLSFILRPERLGMRLLALITDPVVRAVGAITPRIVPTAGIVALAVAWVAAVRLVVFWLAMAKGVRL